MRRAPPHMHNLLPLHTVCLFHSYRQDNDQRPAFSQDAVRSILRVRLRDGVVGDLDGFGRDRAYGIGECRERLTAVDNVRRAEGFDEVVVAWGDGGDNGVESGESSELND